MCPTIESTWNQSICVRSSISCDYASSGNPWISTAPFTLTRLSNSILFLYRFDGNWTDGLRAPSAVPSRLHARLEIRWITDRVNYYSTLRVESIIEIIMVTSTVSCHVYVSDDLSKLLTEFLDTSFPSISVNEMLKICSLFNLYIVTKYYSLELLMLFYLFFIILLFSSWTCAT